MKITLRYEEQGEQVAVRLEDGTVRRFDAEEDLPIVHGLVEEAEFYSGDADDIEQLTPEFIQPYAAFGDGRIMIWGRGWPPSMKVGTEGPAAVVPYAAIREWTEVELEAA